jgi:hypothetical protein
MREAMVPMTEGLKMRENRYENGVWKWTREYERFLTLRMTWGLWLVGDAGEEKKG